MRRRVPLLFVTLLVLFAFPAPADYMDCYPARLFRRPDPKDTRCVIEWDDTCMWCNVEVILE